MRINGAQAQGHRVRAAAAGLLLIAAAAGCSSGSGDDGGGKATAPATATSTTAAASPTTTATPLSVEWQPRLKALADQQQAVSKCRTPSTTACAQALGAIISETIDLQQAIDNGPGEDVYATTNAEANKMSDAGNRYVEEGCEGDPAADDADSPCHGLALTVAGGLTVLDLDMDTDELRAGLR